jgi:NADH-quinone oxidoreductase subunit J
METALFYIASVTAMIAALLVVTRTRAAHALVYLIVSLLAVALIFYLLGAPFAAALEVVIYAGAIMVLFLFVVMMLNYGTRYAAQERTWLAPVHWIGPGALSLVLLIEAVYVIVHSPASTAARAVEPRAVGIVLYGPYVLAVELAAMLLLAALVGAYHLGRRYLRRGVNR